ncbi:MAG: exodeoxyribonuclease V subunit alpha [Myxococcota bacterium]
MNEVKLDWQLDPGEDILHAARSAGVLSALDHQFADRLAELYGETDPGVRWALALACRQEAAGHVCADLVRLSEDGLVTEQSGEVATYSLLLPGQSFSEWTEALAASPLVSRVSMLDPENDDREGAVLPEGESPRPLILDDAQRLYLCRAERAENRLANLIRDRVLAPDLSVDWTEAEAGIARLMASISTPADSEPEASLEVDEVPLAEAVVDEAPRAALRLGLSRPFSVVTGGPGTGKTTLVARLIALLLESAERAGEEMPRVRLLAPTGKAAAAMTNSFARQRASLPVSEAVQAALPTIAETIHRVLFRQTRRDAFGRSESFDLDADIVVIDEASMVDLALMTRLMEACEGVTRVILLGDPGQLASVDSGAVLADLCDEAEGEEARETRDSRQAQKAEGDTSSGASAAGLANSVVTLRTSHRYQAGGGIGRLAQAIRAGDAEATLALLEDSDLPEVERCPADSIEGVLGRLVSESEHIQSLIQSAEADRAKLDQLGLYRVLCAHRRGPLGVESLCATLDEATAQARGTSVRSGWWLGRMLLVTRNAPEQDLWNGDVGLIEETEGELRALFPDGAGGVRTLSAGRLPDHESAIAMSVHKSQGSEFDTVDLVLGDVASRLMTRELLYTGVTRAREKLRIHASPTVIREAVARRVSRDSALREKLRAD